MVVTPVFNVPEIVNETEEPVLDVVTDVDALAPLAYV